MIYEIADLRIDIKNRCDFTTKFCAEYLSQDQTSPAHFAVEVTEEEFLAEKAISERFSDGYIENICLYRNICLQMPKFNRMLLHTCVIALDGNGYAFLGKSGTGKSTHSRLWLKNFPKAYILNGDKPIISFEKEGAFVHGTPWRGKEGFGVKGKVPLKALCFLRQAKENKIQALPPQKAVHLLFGQLLLPSDEEAATKTLELADKILASTPAYLLDCDISKEAVKVSYEKLTDKKFPLEVN
ncbi:MAG: hypothetical protein IJX18_03810 [Clostridia bacterium]|nr:hypothetical protein [Clostridia bacterium]